MAVALLRLIGIVSSSVRVKITAQILLRNSMKLRYDRIEIIDTDKLLMKLLENAIS